MALTESQAAFEQRCDEIVGDGTLKNALVAAGVSTYSLLAFSVGTPQTPPTDDQFDNLATRIFGRGFTIGQQSILRRLHFEATTLVVASLKERVTQDAMDPSSLKKLPVAEKRARLAQQEARLGGINIEGELAPSFHLVDLANQIIESGSIVWIAPSSCSKRDDEVQLAAKERKSTVQVENAQLTIASSSTEVAADTGSELKLQWCWQRRGIAFDQCRLLSWSVHEKWITSLLNALSRTSPPGYQQVKISQLISADREMWTILARERKGSLKADAAGKIPLDDAVTALIHDPRITMHLLPHPSSFKHDPGKADSDVSKKKGGGDPAKIKKRKTRAEKSCPEELKKFNLKCDHGNICWAYNQSGGCQNKTKDKPARCFRGVHVCANCHKPGHSVTVCRGLKNAE